MKSGYSFSRSWKNSTSSSEPRRPKSGINPCSVRHVSQYSMTAFSISTFQPGWCRSPGIISGSIVSLSSTRAHVATNGARGRPGLRRGHGRGTASEHHFGGSSIWRITDKGSPGMALGGNSRHARDARRQTRVRILRHASRQPARGNGTQQASRAESASRVG